MTQPRITASNARRAGGKQGSLVGLTKADITKRLGVKPVSVFEKGNQEKVRWEWRFEVEGVYCCIWDYYAPAKGNTEWSWSGSRFLMEAVFGQAVQ